MNARKLARRRSNGAPQNENKNYTKGIRIGKDTGRVKVFVRVRPFFKDEKTRNESLPFDIQEGSGQLKVFADDRGHAEKTFTLDHIFSPSKDNQHVCDVMTPPLVQSAMNGFNGTLMAYGQTGSGKTYTLMSDTGITKSLVDRVFTKVQDDQDHNYKVAVSYLQIYQEKIFDLLTNDVNKGELNIRENPRTGIYVENLTEYVVRSPTEVLQFLSAGKKRLVFAETKMNRTSSRSHAVLQMSIEKTLKDESEKLEANGIGNGDLNKRTSSMSSLDLSSFGKDVIVRGRLHICDLAGSERIKRTGASGDRLSEAQHINSSLLELGNVIQALADEKATHVPFRNSVLTRLLQESLGGNCKTSLIVCVSPSPRDFHETKCTLGFGSRAMKVQNTAYVNMEVDFKSLSDQLLKQLQLKDDEISDLKRSFQQQLEDERESIKLNVEQLYKENIMVVELEKQMIEDKMISSDAENRVLQTNLNIKSNQIQQLEDSIFSMDDLLKHEKAIGLQLLKTENEITKFSISFKNNDIILDQLSFINLLITIFEKRIPKNHQDEKILYDMFLLIQQDLSNIQIDQVGQLIQKEDLDVLKMKLSKLKKQFEDENSNIELHNGDSNSSCTRYHLFISNSLHHLKECLQHFYLIQKLNETKIENESLVQQLSIHTVTKDMETQCELTIAGEINGPTVNNFRTTDNRQLNDVITNNMVVTHRSTESQSDDKEMVHKKSGPSTTSHQVHIANSSTSTDFIIQSSLKDSATQIEHVYKHNVGVQVYIPTENQAVEKVESPKTGRKLISTTVEDVERVITDIETENVVENPELRRSNNIFSGFGSTLDRIEGMVKNDRNYRGTCSIASRFGLGSYFREDDHIRRNSSLDYRMDEPYSLKFDTSSPKLSDISKKYGNRSFDSKRAFDASNDFDSAIKGYDAMQNNFSGEGNAKLKNLYFKLQGKYKELERTCNQLKYENQENLAVIEQLSELVPDFKEVQEIKKKAKVNHGTSSIATSSIATQTDDTLDLHNKKYKMNNLKVAHIKPRLSEGAISPASSAMSISPASSMINISYDMNENNVVRNVALLHNSQHLQDMKEGGSRKNEYELKTLDDKYRPGEKSVKNNWINETNLLTETNLLQFSPEKESKAFLSESITSLDSTSSRRDSRGYSSIFETLREKDEEDFRSTSQRSPLTPSLRNSLSPRERPQTWFGFPDGTEKGTYTRSFAYDRELNLPSRQNKEEVTFSRAHRSSWALPDWMKTKKKDQSHIKQFIQ